MKREVKVEINKTTSETYKVMCSHCKVLTNHKVLVSANEKGQAPFEYGDIYQWNNDYEIIQCQGCETISFRHEHSNSEEYLSGDIENEGYYSDIFIYPKRSHESWDIKQFMNIPNNLKRIYRETIDCFNEENYMLCGAGIRAIVEGLCKENNITSGTIEIKKGDSIETKRSESLQGKINGLFQQGKLTKANAETLHEHRFLGNTSIHELQSPERTELILALEIIENTFDSIYEMPNKANQMKCKRMLKENR